MDIIERIEKIEARNNKVTLDKKREGSRERKVSIMVITYIFIAIYMWFIGVQQRYIHAIVPTLGFLLSTLSLVGMKQLRLKKFINSKK